MSNRHKNNPNRICIICSDKIVNRERNAIYCNDCCEVIQKQQKKKAFEKYMIKENEWRSK